MNSNVFDLTTVDATVGCREKFKKKKNGERRNESYQHRLNWFGEIVLFCFVLFCFILMIDSVTCCLYSNILMFIQISCIISMFLQKTSKISSFTQDILNFRGEINGVHCKWSFLEQVFGMFFQYTCTFHVLAKKIRNIWSAMKWTVLKKSFPLFNLHQVEDYRRLIVALWCNL